MDPLKTFDVVDYYTIWNGIHDSHCSRHLAHVGILRMVGGAREWSFFDTAAETWTHPTLSLPISEYVMGGAHVKVFPYMEHSA